MKAKPGFIMHAWEKLFSIFDPFIKVNQEDAVREHSKNKWRLVTKYEKAEDEEEEDVYESDSEDEEKDELDIMQEIRIGTRRSVRVQQQRDSKQRQITGYLLRSDQLQMDDEDE